MSTLSYSHCYESIREQEILHRCRMLMPGVGWAGEIEGVEGMPQVRRDAPGQRILLHPSLPLTHFPSKAGS